jgi:hypothetical protein
MTEAARWINLFLDVPREDAVAEREFWSAATGWELSPERGERGQFVTLVPERGSPWVKLQSVDGSPGLHLDLASGDREAAVQRSLSLGATHEWTYDGVPVMRSPGGFVFCHTLAGDERPEVPSSSGALLDQVCLDIPPSKWESETAFWAGLTARELHQGDVEYFRHLKGRGLRMLLQRLDAEQASVTAHPDFAAPDRPGETARHLALGARLHGVHEHWTVLESPGGQVYCLTDHPPLTAD